MTVEEAKATRSQEWNKPKGKKIPDKRYKTGYRFIPERDYDLIQKCHDIINREVTL